MQNPTNVKELFAPLGERLYYFESGKYALQAETSFHVGHEGEFHHSPSSILDLLGRQINLFDDAEVYEQTSVYRERVKTVLDNLKPTEKEKTVYEGTDIEPQVKAVSVKRKRELLDRHKTELTAYLEGLEAILRTREGARRKTAVPPPSSTIEKRETTINLPADFTVKQLNKNFDPQLSVNQAALFLYYLRDLEILPPYSDASIGKLAEAFFVRNQKNVTKGLTDIHTLKQSESELASLKKVLQKLIKEIDNDLKEAR